MVYLLQTQVRMRLRSLIILSLYLLGSLGLHAQEIQDKYKEKPYVEFSGPKWLSNATLYELNVRQFSKEGTFKAVENELPRLKKMGIDIIWLMPIHPIGEKNRKGSLGSYYSVKDYYGVNPEFGTSQDFQDLVNAIHKEGMKVIIDWVANHTSWDNPLVEAHPDWYIRSREGKFQSTPWRDYDDIIDLDYSNPELRAYMSEAMKYWVKTYDIDGFRADVASFVPLDFWETIREELETIKPVFLLAESQDRELHRKAFDATYSWELWNVLHKISTERTPIHPLTEGYIAEHVSIFPKQGIRLLFTENHDKNSWEGNAHDNFKEALALSIMLTVTLDGMPLVYNGQEAGLNRSLAFFEKDPIEWKAHPHKELFTKLFELKHRNKALWNGKWGGEMIRIKNSDPSKVLSFVREKEGDKVLVFANLNPNTRKVQFETHLDRGDYYNWFTQEKMHLNSTHNIEMKPWSYTLLSTTKPTAVQHD